MNEQAFQKIAALVFGALGIGIVIISLMFYQSTEAYKSTSYWVKHTRIVLDEAEQVASLSKDLQLEGNAYYVTGDSSFLLSFKKAKTNMTNHLAILERLIVDSSLQEQRIYSLQSTIQSLLTSSEASFQTRRTDTINDVRVSAIFLHRKELRSKIARETAAIQNEANRLLRIREAANRKNAATTEAILYLLLSFIFVLLLTGFYIVYQYFKKQKKAKDELKESEDRFRLLVNNIKDYAVFMLDSKGNIMNWYSGAEEIKGYTNEEIIGKPISVFYIPEDREKGVPESNLIAAAEKGSFETEGWRVRKDGSTFWADVVITAIYNEEGEVQGFTKITRDYTLHKKAEDEILNTLNKEKELSEMKSNFVSMASHEFRTPLSAILSSVSLIEQYNTTGQQENRSRHIKRIKSSVHDMISILEEFLSLEKIEEGRVEAKAQTFNVKEFTAQLCHELKSNTKPGQVINYIHMGGEWVSLDPAFVKHILTNLISNAIKYSPENSPVKVETQVADEVVTFMVQDKGVGISDEDQRHLFERFFRAANATTIQGTGLGLHITKRYVDMMNGTIAVRSELGKGAAFIIQVQNQVNST